MRNLEIQHRALRNRLKKYDTFESLWVLWSYFQNAYQGKEFPTSIEPHPRYLEKKEVIMNDSKSIIALREIMKCSGYRANSKARGLMRASDFGHLWDSLNELNGIIYESTPSGEIGDKINFELFRIANQQFKWQSIAADIYAYINIYYNLFVDSEIDKMVQEATGLSVIEFYTIGFLFIGEYQTHFAINKDFSFLESEFGETLTREKIERFLLLLSKSREEVKTELLRTQRYDAGFEYQGMVELLNYPITSIGKLGKDYYCCPVLPVLIRSVAESLYFRLIRFPKIRGPFADKYGLRFQGICELNILKYIDSSGALRWGKDSELLLNDPADARNADSDFYVYDSQGLLFIECKTKMIPEKMYINLDAASMEVELEIWGEYICTRYVAIARYLNGDYCHCLPSGIAQIWPVMLTPGDLFLWFAGDRTILKQLDSILERRLQVMGLDKSYLDSYPYIFLTLNELPLFLSLINQHGIVAIMAEMREHQHMGTGLAEKFGRTEVYAVALEKDLGDCIDSFI